MVLSSQRKEEAVSIPKLSHVHYELVEFGCLARICDFLSVIFRCREWVVVLQAKSDNFVCIAKQ